MSFFNWIINFLHAKRLKKIKEELTTGLSIFQQIETPRKFVILMQNLRGVQKYYSLIEECDEFASRVNTHNIKIDELTRAFDDILVSHSISTILSNIDSYDLQQLNEINKVATDTFKFHLPNTLQSKDKYTKYALQLGEIINDYQQILHQHSLLKDFDALTHSFGDEYIDDNKGQKLLSYAKQVLTKIQSYGSKYYKIPNFDEKIVDRHNEKFIQKHLSDSIFDDINGRSLDTDQRRSILCDPKSNLTIAGAGAGKTLTICGKVKWLLENKLAEEKDILLLSYSRESAKDLDAKVSQISSGLTVKTFHALGLEILNNVNGYKKAIEEQFRHYINKFFQEEISKNPQIADIVYRYTTLYMYANTFDKKQFETEGEKFEELKKANFQTLKDKVNYAEAPSLETFKKEYVKSYQELVIANWLFINGVNYEYERAYEHETSTLEKRQYTPDFYLTDYGIYYEHYGINKDGRTPQYTKEKEQAYLEGIEWKRAKHREKNTVCIETYSYEFNDGTIFENLKKRLEKQGVKLQPLSQHEIEKIIYQGQEFESLINLVSTFLSLYKAQYADSTNFSKLHSSISNSNYEKERERLFLSICKAVYEFYIGTLRGENKVDFDDMILQAIESLDKTTSYKYKYIIVDEFQDISQSRLRFLSKLIAHGNSKLFAVGDDWQAIYRFAGCDVNIFLHFAQHFEDAKLNYITSTHRNSAELQSIVEPFITANPEQFKKHIKSDKHQQSPVRIIYHDNNRLDAFIKALNIIAKLNPNAEVLVLGRNRRDVVPMISKGLQVKRDEQIYVEDFPQMTINYKTVHQSKGLESDFVILLSGDEAKNGFPNKMEDDSLLDLVLSKQSTFEFAEERRLFYVALTRTRSIVFILSDKNRTSQFVQEIEDNVDKLNLDLVQIAADANFSCPWCKSGRLVLRRSKSDQTEFYGCSNMPYCKYAINDKLAVKTNNRCPECGDFLVMRDSQFGKFIGCHGYPRCTFKKKITSK